MLNKYSSSPEVRLTVRQSLYRRAALILFGMATAAALVQLFAQGYIVLASFVMPLAFGILYREWADPMAGAVISWREGQWSVGREGVDISTVLQPGAVHLSQLVYLCLRGEGVTNRWYFFLFSDSADQEQLRRLRVRLTLSSYRDQRSGS